MRRTFLRSAAAVLLFGAAALPQDAYAQGQQVVVAKDYIRPGEPIVRNVLELERTRVRPDESPFKRVGDVAGREAAKLIRAGSPITHDAVRQSTAIQRGSRVSVIYRDGAVQLKTSGRARERGTKGTSIEVLLHDTRETLVGTVIGPDTVRVTNR